MNDIDYEQAVSVSEKWAQGLSYIAIGYAVEAKIDDEQCNKHHRLTAKQWERLCTFFVIPDEQMDRKLNFTFQGALTKSHQDHVMKFIQKSIHKKVLDVLIVDHGMLFKERENVLRTALNNMPTEPMWKPKSSVFSKNYTCVFDEDHLRATITRFVGHHLSVNNPLFSYQVSALVHQPTKVLTTASRTSSTGPR